MRGRFGLVWALGGAVAGFAVFAAAALLFAKLSSMTDRDGAVGYFVLGLGVLGALLGLIAGLVWYTRRAPPGQVGASALSGVLDVVGLAAVLAAVLAASVRAFLSLREAPLEYDGAMATLELELRVRTSVVSPNAESGWFTVEVQPASTCGGMASS